MGSTPSYLFFFIIAYLKWLGINKRIGESDSGYIFKMIIIEYLAEVRFSRQDLWFSNS